MSVVEDRFRKRTIEHVTLPEGASRAAARSQVDTDALERIRDDVLPALAAGVAVAVPQNPDYLLRPITASEGALAAHMQPGSTAYGRVGSWRAAGRVRWFIRRFRAGPQSGSPGHVSSSRLVKPSMPISGTGLSCCLPLKVYYMRPFMPAVLSAGRRLGIGKTARGRHRANAYSTSSSRTPVVCAVASNPGQPSP